MKLYYDLHIHSCLSPCGEDDMTPANIAGMAQLCGLELIALTDHNSTRNCPAFFAECRRRGIIPVAGCELTTAEDIHIICLFPGLTEAAAFGGALQRHRILIPNRADIFGRQLIYDEHDRPAGSEEHLLINATDLPLEEACTFARRFGAAVYPAHVDREANGIIAVLGDLPPRPSFGDAEYNLPENAGPYRARYPRLAGMRTVVGSDAHRLDALRDAENRLELSGQDEAGLTAALIRLLNGEGT